MEPDEEGFLYPKIDAAACTDCGLCRRVCPAARSVPVEGDVPKAYALHALDRELLEGSASGGGSTLLAQRMLERGGVVFGAVFDEALDVYKRQVSCAVGVTMGQELSAKRLFFALFPFFQCRRWFVETYIILLFFAPFISRLVQTLSKRNYQILLLAQLGFFSLWPTLGLSAPLLDGGYCLLYTSRCV